MRKSIIMSDSLLSKVLGESPQLRIIDFFLDNKLFDFSKKEIIEGTKMSKATFYGVWKELERQEIVRLSRAFGNTKLYKLNMNNLLVQGLIKVEEKLIQQAANKTATQKRLAVAHA